MDRTAFIRTRLVRVALPTPFGRFSNPWSGLPLLLRQQLLHQRGNPAADRLIGTLQVLTGSRHLVPLLKSASPYRLASEVAPHGDDDVRGGQILPCDLARLCDR